MKALIGTIAKTGEKCPGGGIWKVLESPSTCVTIHEGNLMPPYKGHSVSWEFIGQYE